MAKVKKLNRVLTVGDEAVDFYLKQGYDQIDETGKIIKHATGGRMVTIGEYNKLLAENEKLKKENRKLKSKK